MHPNSHAGYYPGAEPIALKILFAPETGRLLGAQAVGHEGVDKRIDVPATALKAGMTVHELAEIELAYAPPFGSAKDPVNLAGMIAENVLAGDVRVVQWTDIRNLSSQQTVILDVRRPDERQAGHILNSLHIPLDQLRSRLGELPKDQEIVVYLALRSTFLLRLSHPDAARVPGAKSNGFISDLEHRSRHETSRTGESVIVEDTRPVTVPIPLPRSQRS